ncbi:MAG: mechanosensitive ion channel [Anaerolineae bacterium]|nr:mechanosensitive ion channel [Anaerolineae bacterium]
MFDFLINQFDVLFAIFSRRVVQQQILAVLIILFISGLLPEIIRRRRQKHRLSNDDPETKNISRTGRLLTLLYYLLAPLLALILLNMTTRLFANWGYPNGLLEDVKTLIWLWLIYRLILSLLYARFGDSVHPYQVKILTPVFLFLLALQILAILPGSTTFADEAIGFGTLSVTVGSLVAALIVLYAFIVIAWLSKQFMVHILADRLNAEVGVIESVATLTRYALLSLGIIFFLSILGLDFTSLAIIAGGLSVGIGIGLQDIIANFVSGLALLFEQSLRPGDIIEFNDRISKVEKISLRATFVRTLTNEEVIIPNNNFTTNQVVNFTKSDRLVQIVIPLGVSYKSDPEFVRELVTEMSLQHPLVLASPPPILAFRGFGDSSLDFNLVVSIDQPEKTLRIRSDLYYMLWKKLIEHNIEIPFPQRDLNLGTGWEKIATGLQGT